MPRANLPFWQNDPKALRGSVVVGHRSRKTSSNTLCGVTNTAQFRAIGLSLACIGIAGTNLSRVIPPTTTKLIVMAGVAGALSPELQRGDIVIDTKEPLPHLNRIHLGQIHTASSLITTPAQKAQLFNTTRCLAVDMETNIAHEFARKHNATFIALRGISDTATESLDPKLLSLIDSDGNPRITQALKMLATRPWKIAELLRLQTATTTAMTRIAQIFTELIASGWPETTTVRPAD